MFARRTDLAVEARDLWRESVGETGELPGVRAGKRRTEGFSVTEVEILDQRGADALGRPPGTYRTLELGLPPRGPEGFPRAVRAVGAELRGLLPGTGTILAVGLGNASMTPDAVGPLAMDHVLATRHLTGHPGGWPEGPPFLRSVAATRPGVLGTTGVETAETVRGLAAQIRPAAVIAVDALAARRRARLCSTVQISDTGIRPGSGVGDHRAALDRASLGIPVVAIGVPTVVDAATLAADLLEDAGQTIDPDALRTGHQGLFVTPRDIDAQVRDLAKIVGYGIDWALQDLEIAELDALLA